MTRRQLQIPQSIRVRGMLELPKFNSKYSFLSNRKEFRLKERSQFLSASKNQGHESVNLPDRFNRHRYSQINTNFQVPQQIRSLRITENLSSNNIRNRPSKNRLSGDFKLKLSPRQNKRVTSLNNKSFNRSTEFKQLGIFLQTQKNCQDKETKFRQHIDKNRSSTHMGSKKIRNSRIRRVTNSEILNSKKQIGRTNQKSITPMLEKHEEQKVNEIEQETDLSLLMLIQNIFTRIYEVMKNKQTQLYQLLLCYITLDKYEHQKFICSLFYGQKQISLVKQTLSLQRIVIYVLMHLERTKLKRKETVFAHQELALNILKSHLIMSELVFQTLHLVHQMNKNQKPKQLGKQQKIKQITKLTGNIRKKLSEIFQNKQDKMLELINSLYINSTKIQSLEYINVIDKTLKWELLKLPTYPYLPTPNRQFSLILDLDETLIHFNPKTMKLLIRPYAEEFLLKMSKYFQIVIFTAGTKQYADELIDEIDPTHCISYKLFRNHISIHQGLPIKDLNQLGRNLKTTILVDNMVENFRLQPQNGILVSSWYGDPEDIVLVKLESILKNILKLYGGDLRVGIKRWQEYIKQHITFSNLIYELKSDI